MRRQEATVILMDLLLLIVELELIYQGEENGFWEINWLQKKIIEGKVEDIMDDAEIEIIYSKPIEENLPEEVPTPENIEDIRG